MGPVGDAAAVLERVAFNEIAGWSSARQDEALEAFRRSCREIIESGAAFSHRARFGGSRSSWLESCQAALTARDAKQFFETWFQPFRVKDAERPEGLFTGYFEPDVAGSRTPSTTYAVPIYRRPPDLVTFSGEVRARTGLGFGRMIDGQASPYLTRRDIEEGGLSGQGLELVYLRDWADAFFIHIQGSGRVRLEDGGIMRLSFAAKSGLPYTGIGSLLVERGVLTRDQMSMQAIRCWMSAHPQEARTLMWENRSFIFFREAKLDSQDLGALGAQQVQLTPRRSLAVDRRAWMLGTPVWLDTEVPSGEEASMIPFRQLLISQDTGTAITGLARGDVYWGFGEEAGAIAGHMKSPGRMTVLLPVAVAEELGLVA